jgi:hypothetical protein
VAALRLVLEAFVDESYSDDFFFMAAAITHTPRQLSELQTAFSRLLREESERLAIPCPTEVHGHELFQGARMWGDTRLHERLAIAAKVIDLMEAANIKFVIRGIDRAAQRARYPEAYSPYPLVLTHTARQLDRIAGEVQSLIRITCDEIHEHDRHRAMIDRHRTLGTPGYRRSKLPNLDGDLTFVASHESALIQAADLVAYLRHRRATKPNPSGRERRARDHLWTKVDRMLLHDFCWQP